MSFILWLILVWSCLTLSDSRCPTDILVMYRMVLHTEWSEEKFPKQYPEWRPPAQWSVVVGRSHNSSGILWRLGKTASDSIKSFVETGKADMLIRESAQQKKGVLSEFFAPPVTQGVGATEAKFFVDASHDKVSIICRIVPSPDWFIGVDSFDLCRGNKWVDSITLDLEPIDGGTDNGYTFTSPKWATDPRSRISPIRSRYPKHPASSFFYPELEKLPRLAFVTFHKLKEFFLTKQINMDIKGESLKLDRSTDNHTRATVISPLNELTRFAAKQGNKFQKDKKKTMYSTEISAFRSKTEATTKSKVRSSKKHHYRSKSCRVSEWSEWGNCSKQCGFGEQVRKRKVIHFASKNGQPCPPLEESRRCRNIETCRNKTSGFFRWQ
ncbi:spondin-2 [Trichonephila clavata]|uniref:Spondin-2 n=1 Tax=Trichonephila clavata TaxID=2740835 RepID=A0A8X6GLL1_TRICU|nr:spondin-2 [Trichonephila clavata]